MKKDRNAFFESSSYSSSFNPSMPNMPMNQMMPYQSMNNSSSFYAGPNMPMNTYPSNSVNNDFDTKIARLERQMQKLDSRITKLENNMGTNHNDEINMNSNMYMI